MKLRVTCAQMACHRLQPERNLDLADDAMARASLQSPQLVLFPEYLTTGLLFDRRVATCAEPVDGPTSGRFRSWARQYDCWTAGGIVELAAGNLYNTLVLVSPSGQLFAYRKRHPAVFENLYFGRGRQPGIFDTELGRIGVMICWDMIHDRLVQEMQGQVDLLLISSAWPNVETGNIPLPGIARWLSKPPRTKPAQLARTLGVPVLYANMAGSFASPVPGLGLTFKSRLAGQSVIVDGSGAVVRSAGERENFLLTADVDVGIHSRQRNAIAA